MRKIIVLIFLPIFLNACALCSLEIPKVISKIELNIKEKNLQGINFEWVFSKDFTKQLLNNYDKNANNKFDYKEIEEIEEILINYIKPKKFLVNAIFYDNSKEENINLKIKEYKTYYKNQNITFNFYAKTFLELKNDRTIKILLEDNEGFFDFKILKAKQLTLYNSLYLIPNINGKVAFYKVSKEPIIYKGNLLDIVPKTDNQNKDNNKSYYNTTKNILSKYTNKIKILLQDMKDENSLKKLFILIAFSFLYGFFHALGPGHGKTLVTSYFLANGGNWYKALIFSFRIGLIHVASAFVLVISSIYIIKTFISKVLNDISIYTSYFSGITIIAIAIYMLYSKYKSKNSKKCCSCHSCSSNKKDWGIAIAAGIVPCAGMVVIFILTLTLGNYLIGFLSALAMALGMSSIIFVSSIFGQYLNNNIGNKYKNILNLIEYLAIMFILILGILLLMSPLKM